MAKKQTDKNGLPLLEKKDRTYILNRKATPISYQLRSRHTQWRELQWFDEEKKVPRSLRYVTNQNTIFQDEQVDDYVLGQIVFEDGKLEVKANNTTLQKFLAAHPDNVANGGHTFFEFDPEQAAQDDLDKEMKAIEAANTVLSLDIADLEAIGRVLWHNTVDRMTSSELKRDLFREAKVNPDKIMELANNSDIRMRNLVEKAIDLNIIKIKDDACTVVWTTNGKEIVKLPFTQSPKDTLASWMKTDEGLKFVETLTLKLT